MSRLAQFALILLVTAGWALNTNAAELALLRNGYEIRHEAREVVGENTRLYLSADRSGGYIDVKSDEIASFEKDESVRISEPSAAARNAPSDSNPARKPVDVNAAVAAASRTHSIDPDLIASVIHAESSFNPRAVSPKGAQGLMQLMPGTASQLGIKNSFDAEANVDGGTRYLRELLLRYNDDLAKALAAYNAGPHRVDQYKGVPPYSETRKYVSRIIRDFNRKKLVSGGVAKAPESRKVKTSAGPKRENGKVATGSATSFGAGS